MWPERLYAVRRIGVMPIRPEPFVLNCSRCGWKKGVRPKSDVLTPGEWVGECPRCGCEEIETRRAGVIARFFNKIS